MSKLGKKILSAFIETTEEREGQSPDIGSADHLTPAAGRAEGYGHPAARGQVSSGSSWPGNQQPGNDASEGDGRFTGYFDKLFSEANLPGPDYFEFSKMTEAMQSIPDEQARFQATYAGLQVQGLDKQKLLSTADEYLRMLETDAGNFRATVDQAMKEKVHGRAASMREKNDRIRSLTQEISDLQSQVLALQAEIKDNEEKIGASAGGYTAECGNRKARLLADIEKIKQFIH
jgi:hypothetical protein